jgi:hypothetical protein
MVDATTGIITTVVGNGTGTYGGDGVPAVSAQLNPWDICFDAVGNLYIDDYSNQRIRKVDLTGIVNTVAGNGTSGFSGDGGPATSAQISSPEGIAIDPCGNLYIADEANNRIRKVTYPPTLTTPTISVSGVVSAMPGTPVTLTASVSSAGSSYIIHWLNHGTEFTTTTIPSVTYTKPAGIDTITARIVPTGWGCYDSTMSSRHLVIDGSLGATPGLASGEEMLRTWPNPAGDILHISGDIATYRILTIVGATLLQGTAHTGTTTIPLKALPAGPYLLEATNSVGQKTVKRVMKE